MSKIEEEKVKENIDKYFNNILKNSIKYQETFDVNVDLDRSRIELTSNIYSSLINFLNKESITSIEGADITLKKNITSIEKILLQGLKKVDPELSNVNIYTYPPNRILITLSFNKGISDMDKVAVYANIAAELDNQGIQDLCRTSPVFASACNNSLFWQEIFKKKYPKYYPYDSGTKLPNNRVLFESAHSYTSVDAHTEVPYKGHDWKKIFLGMEYYLDDILNYYTKHIRYPPGRSYGAKRQYASIYDIIDTFVDKYFDTLEYLILQDLIDDKFYLTFGRALLKSLNYSVPSHLAILDHILGLSKGKLNNVIYAEADNSIPDLIYEISSDQLEIIDPILKKHGFNWGLNAYLQELLDAEITDNHGGDVNRYIFLTEKLKRPKDVNMYLQDYVDTDIDNNDLHNYILSQLPDKLTKEEIIRTLNVLVSRAYLGNELKQFYNKYSNELSRADKDELISNIKRVFREHIRDNYPIVEDINDVINLYSR